MTEVLEKVIPKCSYFGSCGGCSFQDLAYQEQLELKRKQVEDALNSFQIDVKPVIGSPKPYHYRHMLALTVKKRHGALRFCFVGHDWKQFIPIENCAIADERINQFMPEAFKKLEELPEKNRFRTSQVVLRVGTEGKVYTSLRQDRGCILECKVGDKTFSFSMSSFFQNNFSILEPFIDTLRSLLNPNGGTLFDLYSGVGLLGISLANEYKRVIGIEEGFEAVEHAKKNAARNGIANTEFIEGKVENLLPELIKKAQKPLQVVVDPPRSGLKPEVAECLTQLPVEKLVYVSCHLEALKRDLEVLTKKFQITEVQPMDFFPQTKHVETLVLLEPKEKKA